ncbi:MAG: c-type cytochrome [Verrucomicrobia bacterium]|nr:c-type cytochrome [Verrucomicrobiota bacterium]
MATRPFPFWLLAALVLLAPVAFAAMPRDVVPPDAAELPMNYRLHVEFSAPAGGVVRLGNDLVVPLMNGTEHDLALEHPAKGAPVLRVWSGGKLVRGPEEVAALSQSGAETFPDAKLNLGADFTAVAKFESGAGGTLFSKCAPTGKWSPDAKALFIRGGRLVYDIGWLGALSGGGKVDDGKPHTAALTVRDGTTRLWLDGKVVAEKEKFTKPDAAGHVFKVGRAAPDFAGDFTKGNIASVRVWSRALPDAEVRLFFKDDGAGANSPDFAHSPARGGGRPMVVPAAGVSVRAAWVQPLERSDHGELVAGWNAETREEGRKIFTELCVVCHGTKEQPGFLPTALRFAEGEFKNGSDPYSMFVTLTKGFGQMVPQGQYTTAQKYAVIQYIRETFLRPHNAKQFTEVTPAYLASLPKALARAEAEQADRTLPPYRLMDFGPALFWTYQIAPGNIAQKGIAIRLDDGPGGVSKGRAWMIYDHDTMRVAAATTGDFVDWKGIAFDGSHGTHTGLSGDRHFVNPVGPGWASPDGKWDDTRPRGRDQLPYGPLPREWAHYEGMFLHGGRAVIAASVGGARVLESPGWLDYGTTPVFTRTLNVATSKKPVLLRVAPDSVSVALTGDGALRKDGGFWIAELPGAAKTRLFISRADAASLIALAKTITSPLDLEPLTHGGPPHWPQEVTTTSEAGKPDGAFIADTFPLPIENPWQSWMRPGGFDFTPDGKAAIVATWNGDVWRVDGLMAAAPAPLRWRRIATGLFQPLGVKFRGDEIFITCRDQLVRLHDLNGDGETDFIENFNNDHQVTEHFHEFAMGLQTDAAGNFYYAKSGRHALAAVVPHHGTLLRVSADGARTDILATGFRAANGVCLNDDGTFFVTDQEGFWTPKNRINRVKTGGFYGNMFGYTDVTNTSDSAMEPPMVWITNDKDRSPAELLWVPRGAWGSLGGSLLNLSYGTGRAFIVPHEEVGGAWQGAVCELPMPAFATGIMRGRFAADGALYTCGMFAWAGNATAPGGFHRIRRGEKPAHLPLAIHAARGALTVTFSDPLDAASVKPDAFAFKVWTLKRTANYGSKHYDEHPLDITAACLSADGRTVTLAIHALAPTQCYELKLTLRAPGGAAIERSLHGTIHQLSGN